MDAIHTTFWKDNSGSTKDKLEGARKKKKGIWLRALNTNLFGC
jgi:hypothetical protein